MKIGLKVKKEGFEEKAKKLEKYIKILIKKISKYVNLIIVGIYVRYI